MVYRAIDKLRIVAEAGQGTDGRGEPRTFWRAVVFNGKRRVMTVESPTGGRCAALAGLAGRLERLALDARRMSLGAPNAPTLDAGTND